MPTRLTFFVVAILALLARPGPSPADSIIAVERAPTKVSADQARVVWSSYDPATGNYNLMSRDTMGVIVRLPIAPRKVPFDVDLGYEDEGVELAVYSRCRVEPQLTGGALGGMFPVWATGRRCDVFQFRFDPGPLGKESKVPRVSTRRASEFLPAVSLPGPLAFARVYDHRGGRRGRLPYLYGRGMPKARRLPGGPRGKTGLPGPTSMDLLARRLAFTWDWLRTSHGFVTSDLRLDSYGGRHRLVESETTGLVFRSLVSPSITLSGIDYGRVVSGETGQISEYQRYLLGSRSVLAAPAPHVLISASHDFSSDVTYYVKAESISPAADPGRPPGCGTPQTTLPPKCVIAIAGGIPFSPR
jgi:hypothetical protein